MDKLSDFVDHQIVEVRVETVDGPVDGHCHVLFVHFVDECCYSSGGHVRCPARNGLTNVANVGTVLVRCIFMTQLL